MSSKVSLPSPAFKSRNQMLRHLTGDRKLLEVNRQRQAMVIDVEFEMPIPMLVLIRLRDPVDPNAQAAASVKLLAGVNRATIDEELFPSVNGFSRTVVARSLQVIVDISGDFGSFVPADTIVEAVVVPLDVSVPVQHFGSNSTFIFDIGGVDPSVDSVIGRPFARPFGVNPSVAAVFLGNAEAGMTLYNDSAADVYIALGGVQPNGTIIDPIIIANRNWTLKLAPGDTARIDWTGPVQAIWAAVVPGALQVTIEHA